MQYVNINGTIKDNTAGLPVDNRAFRYGYGLFETMLFKDGQLQLKEFHWQRLFDGMRKLLFDIPAHFTPEILEAEVTKTIAKNKLGHLCRVRLQVFAGQGGLFDGNFTPGYIIECFPLEAHTYQLNEAGLVVGITSGLQKAADELSNLKSSNALIYAIAARQAKANKWNDALICNTQGNIIESTIANIFWLEDGILHTPPLSEGCIAGVMRRFLMQQYPVQETIFTREGLRAADAVLITNAIRRIKWISAVGSATYSIEPVKNIYAKIFTSGF